MGLLPHLTLHGETRTIKRLTNNGLALSVVPMTTSSPKALLHSRWTAGESFLELILKIFFMHILYLHIFFGSNQITIVKIIEICRLLKFSLGRTEASAQNRRVTLKHFQNNFESATMLGKYYLAQSYSAWTNCMPVKCMV